MVKHRVLALFRASMEEGTLPSQWRHAKIIPLKKPDKDNYTIAKAWRPISLLATLGKVLESVVAERISHAVETHGPSSDQPTSERASNDRQSKHSCCYKSRSTPPGGGRRIVSLVSFDVKGAYNGVCKERLLQRMKARGIQRSCSSGWRHLLGTHGNNPDQRTVLRGPMPAPGRPAPRLSFVSDPVPLLQRRPGTTANRQPRGRDSIHRRLHCMGHRTNGTKQPRSHRSHHPRSPGLGEKKRCDFRGGEDGNHTLHPQSVQDPPRNPSLLRDEWFNPIRSCQDLRGDHGRQA